MFTRNELENRGFFPKSKYKWGAAFPKDFQLPKVITNEEFKKIPLYVQVRYEYAPKDGVHRLSEYCTSE